MKPATKQSALWFVVGGTLVLSAVLAVVLLVAFEGGPAGIRLSLAVTVLGYCSALVLLFARRREVVRDAVAGAVGMPAWQIWVPVIGASLIGGVGTQIFPVAMRAYLSWRITTEHTLPLGAAFAILALGTLVLQVVLLRRFWPPRRPHACCAVCKHIVTDSQTRCPECGSESIVRI